MSTRFIRRDFLKSATAAAVGLTLSPSQSLAQAAKAAKRAPRQPYPWKAGLARTTITPTKMIWMTGYGARTKPAEGTVQDLCARALALEDQSGGRAVLVCVEILGLQADATKVISDEVEKRYGLPRDRLMLNFSHTHCGPATASSIEMMYAVRATAEQVRDIEEYTRDLQKKIVALVGAALKDLGPARLSFGHGNATFAINRRKKSEKGAFQISPNPEGPVDHDVPVLRVDSEDGRLRAVVFGYTCHNTTLGGDFYQYNGDYAGFAQAGLEKQRPETVALFVIGCGGDQNPNPRGKLEQAQQYGKELAEAVDKTIGGSLRPVRGPLKSAYEVVPIDFAPPPSREAFEAQAKDKDVYRQWHAKQMLAMLERDGRLPASYPYPVQVWQFGNNLTLVAMAGEVVVDYDLRLKKEHGAERTWVVGYSNEVPFYVPSLRVLEEGGYEASGAMIYYMQPGPFAPSVEETIIGGINKLIGRVRAK